MRLYRGLTKPYRPDLVEPFPGFANFTDCPYIALFYGAGRRGEVLVIDVSEEDCGPRLRKEFWLNEDAQRYSVWGEFSHYLVAQLPAKELRSITRRKGNANAHYKDKSRILARAVDEAVSAAESQELPIRTLARRETLAFNLYGVSNQ